MPLEQNSSLKSVNGHLKGTNCGRGTSWAQHNGTISSSSAVQHHEGCENREFDQLTVPDTGTKFIDLLTKTDQREPKGGCLWKPGDRACRVLSHTVPRCSLMATLLPPLGQRRKLRQQEVKCFPQDHAELGTPQLQPLSPQHGHMPACSHREHPPAGHKNARTAEGLSLCTPSYTPGPLLIPFLPLTTVLHINLK